MAHISYNVKDNKEKESIKNNFIEKMYQSKYHYFKMNKLSNGSELILYDINDVAVLFTTGGEIGENLGNIGMIGKLEDIIKTKKEIEKKIEMKIQLVK